MLFLLRWAIFFFSISWSHLELPTQVLIIIFVLPFRMKFFKIILDVHLWEMWSRSPQFEQFIVTHQFIIMQKSTGKLGIYHTHSRQTCIIPIIQTISQFLFSSTIIGVFMSEVWKSVSFAEESNKTYEYNMRSKQGIFHLYDINYHQRDHYSIQQLFELTLTLFPIFIFRNINAKSVGEFCKVRGIYSNTEIHQDVQHALACSVSPAANNSKTKKVWDITLHQKLHAWVIFHYIYEYNYQTT